LLSLFINYLKKVTIVLIDSPGKIGVDYK